MIYKELENIALQEIQKGLRKDYIKNILKEYLQVYALFYIYTTPTYNKNLIFTGGTCLRHFYELDRLSEDIDFDFIKSVDIDMFADGFSKFFKQRYQCKDMSISIKQKGQQLLLKFPVLQKINLATPSESNLLYIKLDLSPIPSKNYEVITSTQSQFGFNYIAKHYSLPDLMAGKIHAVLRRSFVKGKDNSATIKGRDYFDLLWFIKKGIKPNLKRLSNMLNESVSLEEVDNRLTKKVKNLKNQFHAFRSDLEPLIMNPDFVKPYLDNYLDEYFRNKELCFK
ncbi:MAG: nucleotidyl transferase AbiEii/AbiGii toxin family protein [bacterium]|nr:nucleotidyl transferase AbiEii/AbiGii toxin family protein [bacterium]MBU1916791.1 nucleotidyl transferase AbiEii/AbiGii toxin family protein [bacterium]